LSPAGVVGGDAGLKMRPSLPLLRGHHLAASARHGLTMTAPVRRKVDRMINSVELLMRIIYKGGQLQSIISAGLTCEDDDSEDVGRGKKATICG